MNTKSLLTRTVIVFAALAAAGVVVTASSQLVMNALEQTILVAVGSAIPALPSLFSWFGSFRSLKDSKEPVTPFLLQNRRSGESLT